MLTRKSSKIGLMLVAMIGGLAFVVTMVTLAGLRIPEEYEVARQTAFNADLDTVWDRIHHIEALPDWYPAVQSVTLAPEKDGKRVWREQYGWGRTLAFVELTVLPPYQAIREFDNSRASVFGTWEMSLRQEGGKTVLEIREHGRVSNPLYRFIDKYVVGQEVLLESYLNALALSLDEPRPFPEG